MKRIALLLVLALFAGACATTTTSDEELASGLPDLEARAESRSFLKSVGDALADHVEDCGRGLDFTFRALSGR